MKTSIIAVIFSLFASLAMASEPPPEPPGMVWTYTTACSDQEHPTERGTCVVGHTPDGTIYLAFWQRGQLTFVRKVVDGGYETIWVRPGYAAI